MRQKKSVPVKRSAVSVQLVERRIYLIRGHKVILSPDLGELYQVETRTLVQAVKRNLDRFPADFMFQLTKEECEFLKSQSVISSWGGARRSTPYAFTEQGVAMLSSVLKSKRAIHVNIAIIRAFLQLREILAAHQDLALKIEDIERLQKEHGANISGIWSAIHKLIEPPDISLKQRRIGFSPESKQSLGTAVLDALRGRAG